MGILIAPVILVDDWKMKYEELVRYLSENLSKKAKQEVFFEVILMTYSYIHRKINEEAFPSAVNLYDAELMTGRGKGKYTYKQEVRIEAEEYIKELLNKYFTNNKIVYFS